MKQYYQPSLRLSRRKAPQAGNNVAKNFTPPYSELFDFIGRAKHERRDGQWQWRWSKHVHPHDDVPENGHAHLDSSKIGQSARQNLPDYR